MAVSAGAREIDIVINRTLALQHKWEELYRLNFTLDSTVCNILQTLQCVLFTVNVT